MNLDGILKKIKNTGGNIDESIEDYLFTHLLLTEEEFEFISDTQGDSFADDNNISFISVIYNGEIKFTHYSSIYNKESIDKKGLLVSNNNIIMDLGKGIYVIETDDEVAIDNLYTYFEEKDDENKLLKVTGTYLGEYYQCIIGNGHEHYIVLPNDVPKENINTEIVAFCNEFC